MPTTGNNHTRCSVRSGDVPGCRIVANNQLGMGDQSEQLAQIIGLSRQVANATP
jgi:hypothetical protein